ncbi:MAG: hypothetical protein HC830_13550 [Bacteroidetes bacterium]|nr:hypothetical protein [Bacteroidota bacterium]
MNFEGKPYGKSFQELYNSMNAIVHEYSDIQQEREAQYSFFVSAFQQIPTGILVYNSEGVVKLQNKALLQMLKLGPFLDMHTIDNFRTGFYTFIKSLKTGQSDIIKVRHGENVANISVKVTEFIVRNDSLRLVIFQDVTSELEHAEIESMQKMVRVLTHEIMNSVSPITLASASIIRQFAETNGREGEGGNTISQDYMTALNAIHKRSKGLTNFVENYRQLTRLPQPVFEMVELRQLFANLEVLMRDQIIQYKIRWEHEIVPENMMLLADEKLLEQVMINLVKNSVEALNCRENPYVRLTAVKLGEQVINSGRR